MDTNQCLQPFYRFHSCLFVPIHSILLAPDLWAVIGLLPGGSWLWNNYKIIEKTGINKTTSRKVISTHNLAVDTVWIFVSPRLRIY